MPKLTFTALPGLDALPEVDPVAALLVDPGLLQPAASAPLARAATASGIGGAAPGGVGISATGTVLTAALVCDAGLSTSDRITNTASITGTGGALATVTITEGARLYTTTADSSGHWTLSSYIGGLADGAHTFTIGESGATAITLTFTLDTVAPTPILFLQADTGNSPNDRITANANIVAGMNEAGHFTVLEIVPGGQAGGASADPGAGGGAGLVGPLVLLNGTYTVTVVATDTAGNIATSTLTFTEVIPPTVTVALSCDSGASSNDHITKFPGIAGSATSTASTVVSITEGTLSFTAAVATDGSWSFNSFGTALSDGVHTFTVSQTNSNGDVGSANVTLTLLAHGPSDVISLISDTGSSGADHITRNAAIQGSQGAYEQGTSVAVFEGIVPHGTATVDVNGHWSFTPAGLADGVHTFTISETDRAGNNSSASFTFTLDTVSPVVTAALACDSGSSGTDHITNAAGIGGSGDANTVVRITEGTLSFTTLSASDGNWSFGSYGTALTDGAHTFTISETDAAGNIGTTSLTFTLDTVGPVPTFSFCDTGDSTSDLLTRYRTVTVNFPEAGTATITERGVVDIQDRTVGAGGFQITDTSNGSDTLVAYETDLAGNVGSATITFTLDTVAPVLNPALACDSGASTSDHITNAAAITGTGDAGRTVTITEGTLSFTTLSASDGSWSFGSYGTALTDGVHTFTITETDLAGNIGTASLTFTLDRVAPAPTEALTCDSGDSGSDLITNDATLQGNAPEPGRTIFFNLDGHSYGAAGGRWLVLPFGLTNGQHTFQVVESDLAGNVGSATITFTLDTVAPVLAPALACDSGSSASDHITNAAGITGSGDANRTVTITEGTLSFTTLSASDGSWSFSNYGTALSDGAHTFTITETDVAGNIGTATLTFTLDRVAPTVTFTFVDTGENPSDGLTNHQTVTINYSDAGTGLDFDNGQVNVIGTAGATSFFTTATFDPGQPSDQLSVILTPSGTGTVSLLGDATDLAGTITTASFSFTYDHDAPVLAPALLCDAGSSATDLLTNQPGIQGRGDGNRTVTITEGTLSFTTLSVDSGVWQFNGFGSALSDGAHTFTITETDAAGNIGSATLSFTLESVAPTVTVALVSDTGSSASDGITRNPALRGTTEAFDLVSISDGAILLGTTAANGAGAWSFTPSLADGPHTLTIGATDAAGNIGTTSIAITLAAARPVLSLTLVENTGRSASDLVTKVPDVLLTNSAAGTLVVRLDGKTAAPVGIDAGSELVLGTSLADGVHTFTVTETDFAGNIVTASLTYVLDRQAPLPAVRLLCDTGSSASDRISRDITLTAVREALDTVTIAEGSTILGTISPGFGDWTFTPSLADGVHTLTITETDIAGNIGSTTITVIKDTAAPVLSLTLASDTGVSGSDLLTRLADLRYTSSETGNLLLRLDGGTATALDSSAGPHSFAPGALADGLHTVTITETDAAGNVGSATLSFTLDTTRPVDAGAPVTLSMDDTADHRIGPHEAQAVRVTVSGLDIGSTGLITLSDGLPGHQASAQVLANGTLNIDVSGFADGTVTVALAVFDLAGNPATATVPGASLTLQQHLPVPKDFNGNGLHDALVMNDTTGAVTTWLLNGPVITGGATLGGPGTGWSLAGSGDFNGDGSTDLAWLNTATSELWTWDIRGGAVISAGAISSTGPSWHIAGIGDLNGDGRDDILWQNAATGELWSWEMNDRAIGATRYLGTLLPGGWAVQGIADFNGDGTDDILFRHADGSVFEWQMAGGQFGAGFGFGNPGPEWNILAIGDFTGDGRADILWRRDGTNEVWEWQTTWPGGYEARGLYPIGPEWQVVGTGDVNADGTDDLLWRNSATGEVVEYQMQGTSVTSFSLGQALASGNHFVAG